VLCLSKGINSGYLPFGAVVLNQKLVYAFEKSNDFLVHGSSQNGNLLACAATIATINQYRELNIKNNVIEMGLYIVENLRENLQSHDNVKDIRNKGLMIFIELHQVGHFFRIESIAQHVNEIRIKLMRKGLIVFGLENGILILPMLTITTEEADFIIEVITSVLSITLF
jgi:adenosylmethionine-8-amino-7-oxononanoate aminotransferase